MNEKSRQAGIIIAAILGSFALLYLGGLFAQLMTNYQIWMDSGGMWGGAQIASPDWNPLVCFVRAFSWNGLKGMGLLLAAIAGIYLYVKFHDKFTGEVRDPRGFTISKSSGQSDINAKGISGVADALILDMSLLLVNCSGTTDVFRPGPCTQDDGFSNLLFTGTYRYGYSAKMHTY